MYCPRCRSEFREGFTFCESCGENLVEELPTTLTELSNTLPNGFHDSVLHSLTVDYSKREVRLNLSVWVGELRNRDEAVREAHRDGELVLSEVGFCIVEAPDTKPWLGWGRVTIDIGEFGWRKWRKLPDVPKDMFINWIQIFEWNSYIFVAARDARLEWRDERCDTEPPRAANRQENGPG